MRRLRNWISRKRFPYEPLIHIGISRSRLLHNLAQFRTLAPNGCIAPVLKSNAYGHGLLEVAHILEDETNIPFFVVDSYFEAIALRAEGIKTPLLVIGYTRPDTILNSNLKNVSFTITTIETLREVAATSKKVRIQVKIDTGMHRQGISMNDVREAIKILQTNPRIVCEGICTHLAESDAADEAFCRTQLEAWDRVAKEFCHWLPTVKHVHSCNTDGTRFSQGTHDTLSRLGIGLYGLSETPQILTRLDLRPALEMNTIITSLRTIKAGETIGYSRTFVAQKDMTVATIPVGYYEGLDRRLSSGPDNQPCAYLKVGTAGTICPIVGRVSMNIISIDVSDVKNVSVGIPVQVISSTPTDPNSIRAFAKACGTIDYEFVVRIPTHLKREIRE